MGHFLKSEHGRRYDVIISCWIILWRHTWIKWYMTSYLPTCRFYQKMSCYNIFQHEIPDRISFKNSPWSFWKFSKNNISMGEREFFKKTWLFASFRPIFNLKAVLNSQKIGELKWGVFSGQGKTFVFPIVSLLPLHSNLKIRVREK